MLCDQCHYEGPQPTSELLTVCGRSVYSATCDDDDEAQKKNREKTISVVSEGLVISRKDSNRQTEERTKLHSGRISHSSTAPLAAMEQQQQIRMQHSTTSDKR